MKIKAIYDNGGKTLDRITIVTTKTRQTADGFLYDCIGASQNGVGIFTWSEGKPGRHLGKRIQFTDLTKQLQSMVIEALNDNN